MDAAQEWHILEKAIKSTDLRVQQYGAVCLGHCMANMVFTDKSYKLEAVIGFITVLQKLSHHTSPVNLRQAVVDALGASQLLKVCLDGIEFNSIREQISTT